MYCVKCGVKLKDTEKKCPLCETEVYHPSFPRADAPPLYPEGKMPQAKSSRSIAGGAITILFLIPLAVCFCADLMRDGVLQWFGFVAGALLLAYVVFALPIWFKKPNPVVFMPCSFAAAAIYLWYIDLATEGGWFFPFAFAITLGLGAIVCTAVALFHCLRRGRLYILGGTFMALGFFLPLIEVLLQHTFRLPLIGWSLYPLVTLFLLGGLLIYLAINQNARSVLERKLFF